jgi:dTDP-glucose 4,6-dehydratase
MLDSSKIRRQLGWSDRIALSGGLDDCAAWIDRHAAELRRQPLDYVHKP